jgi:hypothetical protein
MPAALLMNHISISRTHKRLSSLARRCLRLRQSSDPWSDPVTPRLRLPLWLGALGALGVRIATCLSRDAPASTSPPLKCSHSHSRTLPHTRTSQQLPTQQRQSIRDPHAWSTPHKPQPRPGCHPSCHPTGTSLGTSFQAVSPLTMPLPLVRVAQILSARGDRGAEYSAATTSLSTLSAAACKLAAVPSCPSPPSCPSSPSCKPPSCSPPSCKLLSGTESAGTPPGSRSEYVTCATVEHTVHTRHSEKRVHECTGVRVQALCEPWYTRHVVRAHLVRPAHALDLCHKRTVHAPLSYSLPLSRPLSVRRVHECSGECGHGVSRGPRPARRAASRVRRRRHRSRAHTQPSARATPHTVHARPRHVHARRGGRRHPQRPCASHSAGARDVRCRARDAHAWSVLSRRRAAWSPVAPTPHHMCSAASVRRVH